MRKTEDELGEQARALRKLKRDEEIDSDYELDDEFRDKPNETIEKAASQLQNTNLKSQLDYYGYVLEPFNMNNERKVGNIDQTGFFVFDKQKENDLKDPWLDALDQDPYKQGLIQNEDWKERKKKVNLNEEEIDIKPEKTKIEKMSQSFLIDLTKELIEFAKNGQKISELLRQIKPNNKNNMKIFKKNIRKTDKTKKNESQQKIIVEENEKNFNRVVELCDILASNGNLEIYNQTKEELETYLKDVLQNKNFQNENEKNFINSGSEDGKDQDISDESDKDTNKKNKNQLIMEKFVLKGETKNEVVKELNNQNSDDIF